MTKRISVWSEENVFYGNSPGGFWIRFSHMFVVLQGRLKFEDRSEYYPSVATAFFYGQLSVA